MDVYKKICFKSRNVMAGWSQIAIESSIEDSTLDQAEFTHKATFSTTGNDKRDLGKRLAKAKKTLAMRKKQKYDLRVAGMKLSSASKATARKEKLENVTFRDLEQVSSLVYIWDMIKHSTTPNHEEQQKFQHRQCRRRVAS